MKKLAGFTLALMLIASTLPAQKAEITVPLRFDQYYSLDQIYEALRALNKAYPQLTTLETVGKSEEGRPIMAMTVNNPKTGSALDKPGVYVDGNMHGNEIQGGEISLYTIWYLMEYYDRNPDIKRLVDERVFYVVPTVNHDGRDFFMDGTGAGARTGHVPVDEDGDGLFDEDGPDDLNGNGVIEQIRKHTPGEGTHRANAGDPRIMEGPHPWDRKDRPLASSHLGA